MLLRRLFSRPADDTTSKLEVENQRLRAQLARVGTDMVRRRTDDIIATRDELMPIPKPGSPAARLLSRNRAQQRRLQSLVAERASVAQELVDAAADARAAGMPQLARSLRARAESILDGPTGTPIEVDAVQDSGSFALYAETVASTWHAVQDRRGLVDDFWTRLVALSPEVAQPRPPGLSEVASLLVASMTESWPGATSPPGPPAGAEFIRTTFAGTEVTPDWYALCAESALYALSSHLGRRWTDEVRTAWCAGIDALARSLGLSGCGVVVFSVDEDHDVSGT